MKTFKLHLIRHGMTAVNLQGLYIGSGTDLPLCDEGRAQLAELKENMDAIEEHTGELKEKAFKYSHDIHSKVDTLLKDVLLENVVGEYRNVSAQMDVAERQLFDGSLVQSIAEQGTDVMHCATMLFLGMVDDATTFAETRGGGGGGSDLKWGRDEDEDNRAWALRSMRMASRMMRPAIGKKPKR